MIRQIVICGLFLPAPAVADALNFDAETMETCLVASDGAAEMQSCIGMAAAACINGEGQDIPLITACYAAEARYWQENLTEDGAHLIETSRTAPEFYGASPGVGLAGADVVTQGAAYIDAVCGLTRLQWSPDMDPVYAELSVAECQMRMTGEHVVRIWQLLEQF